jgi:hypothetical protein
MIVELHMCCPEGEALRQQLANALNALKQDNRYVVNAMLNSGMEVPDTVIEAGLNYVPSRHNQKNGQPVQVFYGMKAMMDSGEFSCGGGAAMEAAVLEEKYGIPTEVLCVATADDDYHSIFVTPEGPVDPVENWLRYWEGQAGLGGGHVIQSPPRKRNEAQPLGAHCRVVEGRVQCEVEGANSCVVDPDTGLWHCPDPALHGKPVDLVQVFQGERTNQRWGQTKDGLVVPVAANSRPPRKRQVWRGI